MKSQADNYVRLPLCQISTHSISKNEPDILKKCRLFDQPSLMNNDQHKSHEQTHTREKDHEPVSSLQRRTEMRV